MKKIVEGLVRFQREIFPAKRQFFNTLANSQHPMALFITCADSRIVPDLLTQTAPGDLFLCRNAGNIVPPYGANIGGVSATIEYAVLALGIKHIIVCGHSDCGAMRAALDPEKIKDMPAVADWLSHAEAARRTVVENCRDLPEDQLLDKVIQENVVAQLDHLRTHPSVAARVARGGISLYGWFYRIETGEVLGYDAVTGEFRPHSEQSIPSATPRPRYRINGSVAEGVSNAQLV
jgi:carbonic anhydrase